MDVLSPGTFKWPWAFAGNDLILANGLACYPGNRLHQALHNRAVYKNNEGLDLKLVFGSFALMASTGKVYLWADSGKPRKNNDIHVWLEDHSGNVYDVISPVVYAFCKENSISLQLPIPRYNSIINGEGKAALLTHGVVYEPLNVLCMTLTTEYIEYQLFNQPMACKVSTTYPPLRYATA